VSIRDGDKDWRGDDTSSCCYSSHDAGGCVGVGEGETVLSRRGDPKYKYLVTKMLCIGIIISYTFLDLKGLFLIPNYAFENRSFITKKKMQCSGSVTFWYGSGSCSFCQ
jgi:hypothetical protein